MQEAFLSWHSVIRIPMQKENILQTCISFWISTRADLWQCGTNSVFSTCPASILEQFPNQEAAVDYARGLFNMIIFDPDADAKRRYLADLQRAVIQYPCQETAVCYAYALLAYACFCLDADQKRNCLDAFRFLLEKYAVHNEVTRWVSDWSPNTDIERDVRNRAVRILDEDGYVLH